MCHAAKRFIKPLLGLAGGLLAASCSVLAQSKPVPCSLKGSWTGTIGSLPISMEINDDYGEYNDKESLIGLLRKPESAVAGVWFEFDNTGEKTGSLQLACDGGNLRGDWQNPAKSKQLPIKAQRLKDSANDRRIAKTPLIVCGSQTVGGHKLQVAGLADVKEVQTIQIANPSASEHNVNSQLRQLLDTLVAEHLQCQMDGFVAGRFQNDHQGAWIPLLVPLCGKFVH